MSWEKSRELGSIRWFRFAVWAAGIVGRPISLWVMKLLALGFLIALPDKRRISRTYLQRALKRPISWRDLYRHFYHFAVLMIDKTFILRHQLNVFRITTSGDADINAVDGGAILLGAHMGNFELLRALGTRQDHPIKVFMNQANAQKVAQMSQEIDPSLKDIIIDSHQNEHAYLEAKAHVESGGWLGMLGDRNGISQKSIHLPFLGQTAEFPIGPLLMAYHLQVPVILFFPCYQSGKHYHVHFEAMPALPPYSPKQRQQVLETAIQHYVKRLEAMVQQSPYNWFNFYDFWQEFDTP